MAPDGRRCLSGGTDTIIRLWDLRNKREEAKFPGHRLGVTGLAFSPGGQHFVSVSQDHDVRLWGLEPPR
jgi:WD40 repeat protein